MWKFRVEQKRFEIGTVKIGGLPGEHPTVLIGSIFYRGQKILKNEITGDFDDAKAEELIKQPDLKQQWQEKSRALLADKIDVLRFMVETIAA